MTSYGELLDQAISELRTATAAIGSASPADVDDQVHVAVARTQLYRSLHQQLLLVGASPNSRLARELAHATASTISQLHDIDPPGTPTSPVAAAIVRTAAAVEGAARILVSHLAPPDTAASPPAPAAAALLEAGHGRAAAGRRIGDVVTAGTRCGRSTASKSCRCPFRHRGHRFVGPRRSRCTASGLAAHGRLSDEHSGLCVHLDI
ncbi:hypothetical protein [Dactylosporangium sp. CA-233914]|uniref:hypothetical protein n=1 Tax=Dactylosporangium sp. CA-233914 TaxID=3239934 RepID=UPI003D8B239A